MGKNNSQNIQTPKNLSVKLISFDETTGNMYAGKEIIPDVTAKEPADYIQPKILNVQLEVLNFVTGIYRLTLGGDDVLLDGRAEYWLFWRTPDGTFEELSDDCRSVIVVADPNNTADRNIELYVGVRDNFGYRYVMGIKGLKGNY